MINLLKVNNGRTPDCELSGGHYALMVAANFIIDNKGGDMPWLW